MSLRPHVRPVIIGAGPAGLTAAYELARHGYRPVVVEKDARYVGGLARTIQYKTFRFDIGGHRFFSKSEEVERLWEEIVGSDLLHRPRLSRILYRGTFFDYPLKAGNALRGLGVPESIACVASYLRYQVRPIAPERSFEDWVVNRFGRRLFEIFFRTYTEKVWGMPCSQISADWASQRIKGLSLKDAIVNAFFPNRKRSRATTIKTLIDAFRYPRLGPGMMWELTRDRVLELGGQVRLGTAVSAVCHDHRQVTAVETQTGEAVERIHGDWFISSMPLRELVERWTPSAPPAVVAAAGELRYRDFLVVALVVRRSNLFPDNWIYVHDPTVKVGRIQNFRSWSPDMVPDPTLACLGMEYFCFEHDDLWTMTDQALVDLAAGELERTGLVRASEVIDGAVVRMEKAYPVYDAHYQRHVQTIRDYLDRFPNIQVVGRNGMHKYNNQDHSMMTALLAARNIMGARFDVWRVNTDAEYLEEDEGEDREARLVPLPRTDEGRLPAAPEGTTIPRE